MFRFFPSAPHGTIVSIVYPFVSLSKRYVENVNMLSCMSFEHVSCTVSKYMCCECCDTLHISHVQCIYSMNSVARSIRIAGIVITVIAIPISLLTLFGLYNLSDSEPVWVRLLCTVWAFVNFAALPFILAGFATRYTFDLSIHLATALFTIIALVFFLILFSALPGSLLSVLFLALPPTLYLSGYLMHRQSLKQKKN